MSFIKDPSLIRKIAVDPKIIQRRKTIDVQSYVKRIESGDMKAIEELRQSGFIKELQNEQNGRLYRTKVVIEYNGEQTTCYTPWQAGRSLPIFGPLPKIPTTDVAPASVNNAPATFSSTVSGIKDITGLQAFIKENKDVSIANSDDLKTGNPLAKGLCRVKRDSNNNIIKCEYKVTLKKGEETADLWIDITAEMNKYMSSLATALTTTGGADFGNDTGYVFPKGTDIAKELNSEGFWTIDAGRMLAAIVKNGDKPLSEQMKGYLGENIIHNRIVSKLCSGFVKLDEKSRYQMDMDAINKAFPTAGIKDGDWQALLDAIKNKDKLSTESTLAFVQELNNDSSKADSIKNSAQQAAEALKTDFSAKDLTKILTDAFHKGNLNMSHTYNTDGSVKFDDPSTKVVIDTAIEYIINTIANAGVDISTLGGKDGLKKIVTMAIVNDMHQNEGVVSLSTVLSKAEKLLERTFNTLQRHPDYLPLMLMDNASGRPVFTTELTHYDKNNTVDGDDKVQIRNANVTYDNETQTIYWKWDLDGNGDTAALTTTIKELLKRMDDVYPVKSETFNPKFYEALKTVIGEFNNKTFTIKAFVDRFLQEFDKIFDTSLIRGTLGALGDDETTAVTVPTDDTTRSEGASTPETDLKELVSNSADAILAGLGKVRGNQLAIKGLLYNCRGEHSVSFVMNKDGDFRFRDSALNKLYSTELFNYCKEQIGDIDLPDNVLRQIYNAAWTNTFNTGIKANDKVDTLKLVNNVLANFERIVQVLKRNPELIKVLTADNSGALPDENPKINYKGVDLSKRSGNLTLPDSASDRYYQSAMNDMRAILKEQYVPPMEASQFEYVFLQAQKEAIDSCSNNDTDIPADTVNSANSRKGDGYRINLQDLMKVILYKFEKLVCYQNFGYITVE